MYFNIKTLYKTTTTTLSNRLEASYLTFVYFSGLYIYIYIYIYKSCYALYYFNLHSSLTGIKPLTFIYLNEDGHKFIRLNH